MPCVTVKFTHVSCKRLSCPKISLGESRKKCYLREFIQKVHLTLASKFETQKRKLLPIHVSWRNNLLMKMKFSTSDGIE